MTVAKRTESNVQQAVPFFWVDGLGFQMTKEWNEEGKLRWCWLEIGFLYEEASHAD